VIIVPHRACPGLNKPSGVMTLKPVKEGQLVWRIDLGRDRLFDLSEIECFTDVMLESAFLMGLFRPAWSRNVWILPAGAGALLRQSSKEFRREANLRFEQDTLVATRNITTQKELVAPADWDADRAWKNRVFKSGGWKRDCDERAVKPSLRAYLKYVERTG
jgi:hypothetical protein